MCKENPFVWLFMLILSFSIFGTSYAWRLRFDEANKKSAAQMKAIEDKLDALAKVETPIKETQEDIANIYRMIGAKGHREYVIMDTLIRLNHHTGQHKGIYSLCPECLKLIEDAKLNGISEEELLKLKSHVDLRNRIIQGKTKQK